MEKSLSTLFSVMLLLALSIVCPIALAQDTSADVPPPFDLQNGNAAVEVVIPTVVPIIFQHVSSTGGDATLIIRTTTLITNAWFDAAAPYHGSAQGVYSHLGRRPASESSDNAHINTALLHASYRVLSDLLPSFNDSWRNMLIVIGLDPDDASDDTSTAVGIGNLAGWAVAEGRRKDGMNQLGDFGREYNFMPYADYTGYGPRNSAKELRHPSLWQPDIQRRGMGLYKEQQFVTPQYGLVEPYSYSDQLDHSVPPPYNSDYENHFSAYQQQADEVLNASAQLTDEQKLMAELFDDKIMALGFSALFALQSNGLSLLEFIHLDFLTNMAAFDAGIFVWQEKREYDAVRPFSAIRYLYGDSPVHAWAGPYQGALDIPANEWASYLEEADHPEYPSASSCFCAAHSQSARRFFGGSDQLGYSVSYLQGASRIEPGAVPATDTTLVFDTWTDFEQDCGQSRVWAGVHFQDSVDQSLSYCGVFGDLAYEYLQELLAGTAPMRKPSRGKWNQQEP